MVYFSLPCIYENNHFNNKLKNFIFFQKDKLNFSEKVCIESVYGNFPFSFWHGDVSVNLGDNRVLLYNDVFEYITVNKIPTKFDFSNIFLTEKDFFDSQINMILKMCEGLNYSIKVSNFKVKDYISENFIGYKFILSENSFLNEEISKELINDLIKLNYFEQIELPSYLNQDIELLKNIETKEKIVLTLGDYCQFCSNKKYWECKKFEQKNQSEYSTESIYYLCKKNYDFNSLKEEFNYLRNLGFNNFKIKSPPNTSEDIENFREMIIRFFIKPENIYDFNIK